MGLISENVIPGNHGKVFTTNAKNKEELEHIKKLILEVDGVKDVVIEDDVYPKEFIVYTSSLVSVIDVENAVKRTGLHAIPKSLFAL